MAKQNKYTWKKDKFTIIRNAISKEMAEFLKNYILLKRRVVKTYFDLNLLHKDNHDFGTWYDPQVPGTFSVYGDVAMETLLVKLKPMMEKVTKTKLFENYAYTRVYKVKDELKRHKDRFSCEISTTLNLGGDKPWPIYINPKQEEGTWNNTTEKYIPSTSKGIKVDLKPGDMLLYRGNILEHWREPFIGNHCAQVFLHYNDVKTPGAEENALDKRPHLGLPNRIRRAEKKIP